MKIAIFGDSFADPKKFNPTSSWVDILSEKYDTTCYAKSSSNLYCSVRQLYKNISLYDKCILVATGPHRLHFKTNRENQPEYHFVAGMMNLESKLQLLSKTPEDNWLQPYYQAALQYYSFLQDDEFDVYVHNLIFNDIKNKFQNLIIIPGFIDSALEYSGVNVMNDIYLKETLGWGVDPLTFRKEGYDDRRNCHMTIENNLIFANKVVDWLSGEPVKINLDDFVVPSNKEFYIYRP